MNADLRVNDRIAFALFPLGRNGSCDHSIRSGYQQDFH